MRVERDPCADCHGHPTETDWLAIFLALAAVVYSGAHYIGYDFEYLQHYFHFARSRRVRATVAVLERISIDLIRFALAILGLRSSSSSNAKRPYPVLPIVSGMRALWALWQEVHSWARI